MRGKCKLSFEPRTDTSLWHCSTVIHTAFSKGGFWN